MHLPVCLSLSICSFDYLSLQLCNGTGTLDGTAMNCTSSRLPLCMTHLTCHKNLLRLRHASSAELRLQLAAVPEGFNNRYLTPSEVQGLRQRAVEFDVRLDAWRRGGSESGGPSKQINRRGMDNKDMG